MFCNLFLLLVMIALSLIVVCAHTVMVAPWSYHRDSVDVLLTVEDFVSCGLWLRNFILENQTLKSHYIVLGNCIELKSTTL